MADAKAILGMDDAKRDGAIQALFKSENVNELKTLISQSVVDTVLVKTSKGVLTCILTCAFDESCSQQVAMAICEHVIQEVQRRVSSFGEEAVRAREILVDFYEAANRINDAIRTLMTLPMDQGLRSSADEYKVSVWVRIAELSLSTPEQMYADQYISKAWPLLKHVKDQELRLRFSTCFAEVKDGQCKFRDAAIHYYELSNEKMEEASKLQALRKAIISIILADAGPQRSRLLTTLYKDERVAALGELHGFLSKVYHNRILRPKDVALLQPHLSQHHKALNKDGRTVIDNAIMQHNLLSASKLYYNINFSELGALLGVPSDQAEKIAAQMVAEDRLRASIDQVKEVIVFSADMAAPVQQWDSQITNVCNTVSDIADAICFANPSLTPLLNA